LRCWDFGCALKSSDFELSRLELGVDTGEFHRLSSCIIACLISCVSFRILRHFRLEFEMRLVESLLLLL
jgi:hypothetical protein